MRILAPLFAAALYCGSVIALFAMTAASPQTNESTTVRFGEVTVVAVETPTLIVEAPERPIIEREIS
ncbi:MAG TPA: hypothetical protein VM737_05040 [Gemmatimonadota bacterium]|nr:hypothetical protein [Gemmatimonadota bacterium]